MALRFSGRVPLRRFCNSPTAESLLGHPSLTSLLNTHSKTATETLPTEARLAALQHFATVTGRPVASNVLPSLSSAADMAEWYSNILKPKRINHHAKGIAQTINREMDIDVTEDHSESVKAKLPSNLQLDPATFKQPKEPKFGR